MNLHCNNNLIKHLNTKKIKNKWNLTKNELGLGSERRLKLLVGAIGCDKCHVNSHSLEGNGKKIVSAAVDRRARNDVVAA